MNQPIDYLGAVQSTFNLAHTYNLLGARIQITQVTWAFYLDKASKIRKAGELNLATTATIKQDLVHLEFTVNAQGFAGQPFGTAIPEFMTALENALTPCLQVLESSAVNSDGGALTKSQVSIVFVLDDHNQLEFIKLPRDAKNDVIHKLTFTIQTR
ncbi:MAG: hypothetical protein RLZZ156_1677 [Deinococcota bacterium]|jgi:hypothetical protein